MNKRVLLFDIDRTIFDTDSMIKVLDKEIKEILGNPNSKEFKKVEENYIKSLKNDRYFTPQDYIKSLCDKFNFSYPEKLSNVFYGKDYEFIYKDNLFPQTLVILNKLKNSFEFGIFSEGTEKFQNNKFKSLHISEYFNKDLIFIVPEKDNVEIISKVPKESIVVDDKERICEFLTINKIKAIWINRMDKRKSDNFETIHDLLELETLLM